MQTNLDLLGVAWQLLTDLINRTFPNIHWQLQSARSRIYSAPPAPPIA